MCAQLALSITLTEVSCGECGGVYALNYIFVRQKEKNGGYWKCPYCKCSWGYGESEIDRLNKKVAATQRALETERKRKEWAQKEAKIAENRRRAQKGITTRIKNRVGHGVCPCCNRTFQNLKRHMTAKHPDFSNDKDA